MTLGQEFRKGFWRDNAVFRLLLGLCPALAVTTMLSTALTMSVAVIGILQQVFGGRDDVFGRHTRG